MRITARRIFRSPCILCPEVNITRAHAHRQPMIICWPALPGIRFDIFRPFDKCFAIPVRRCRITAGVMNTGACAELEPRMPTSDIGRAASTLYIYRALADGQSMAIGVNRAFSSRLCLLAMRRYLASWSADGECRIAALN